MSFPDGYEVQEPQDHNRALLNSVGLSDTGGEWFECNDGLLIKQPFAWQFFLKDGRHYDWVLFEGGKPVRRFGYLPMDWLFRLALAEKSSKPITRLDYDLRMRSTRSVSRAVREIAALTA